MKELGIDISKQRSRMLTGELVQQADYIFGMTHSHADTVQLLYPKAMEKTFLLREFDETLDPYEKDISDPIGGSFGVYRHCRDQIEQGIAGILHFIEHGPSGAARPAHKAVTFAIGSDHGGFDLKEDLKKHLEARGVSYVDLGTHNRDSTDYPDYAQAVGESIVENKAELGLLVCTTGIGMCITANKITGIRASSRRICW